MAVNNVKLTCTLLDVVLSDNEKEFITAANNIKHSIQKVHKEVGCTVTKENRHCSKFTEKGMHTHKLCV